MNMLNIITYFVCNDYKEIFEKKITQIREDMNLSQ